MGGKIVNLCDLSAGRPWKGYLACCVSKAGLVCLTKALARETAPVVQVNAVAPGIIALREDWDRRARGATLGTVLGWCFGPGREQVASAVPPGSGGFRLDKGGFPWLATPLAS